MIDANRVTALIDELGLEGPDKDYFTKVLTTNERAATQFVGQRERQDLLTRRTQELSTKEKELERRANAQITEYAQQLAAADDKIRQIMTDFEKADISRATAEARLQRVKTTYNLSDEDIPPVTTPVEVRPADKQIDIKKILGDFKNELLRELAPELSAFPRVAAIQSDIFRQHKALTGQDLTLEQMDNLMKVSQAENGPSLLTAWKREFKIDQLQQERHETELKAKWEQERNDADKARASEEALRGVRRSPDGEFKHLSPVFREYKTNDEPGSRDMAPVDGRQSAPPPVTRVAPVQNTPKLSGAERAAARFLERRAQGIPMGKEAPVGAGR